MFIVPLIHFICTKPVLPILVRWRPFSWAFLLQILVLGLFVIDMQFLAGRYVSALQFLAVPVIGYGLWQFMVRFSRWRIIIIGVSVIVMISNVVSLNTDKRGFIEAGKWLSKNIEDSPRVYMESSRSAYYAGWRFSARQTEQDRAGLAEALKRKAYDIVVLEHKHDDPAPEPWIASLELQEIRRFPAGGATIIVTRLADQDQGHDRASNTKRILEKTESTE